MGSKKWRNVKNLSRFITKNFYQFFFSTAWKTRLRNKERKKTQHQKKEKRKRVFLVSTKEKQFPLPLFMIFFFFFEGLNQRLSLRSEICFDFPSTLKLFAFMINYEIPLEFYISSEKKGRKTFPFIKYLSDEKFRNFHLIICHSMAISEFSCRRRAAFHFLPSTPSTLSRRSEKCENIYFEIERHFNIIKLHFLKATHNELIYTCGMNNSSVTLETEHRRSLRCATILLWMEKHVCTEYFPCGNFRFCHRKATSMLPPPEPPLNQWRESGITFSSSARISVYALASQEIQIINK